MGLVHLTCFLALLSPAPFPGPPPAVTSREEATFDLSLEIDTNCSLTSCLRNFSSTETLSADDKFHCDECGCLQEAQVRAVLCCAVLGWAGLLSHPCTLPRKV